MRSREIGGILVGLGGASVIGFVPVIRPEWAYWGIGVGLAIMAVGLVMFFWRSTGESDAANTGTTYVNAGINTGHVGPVNNQRHISIQTNRGAGTPVIVGFVVLGLAIVVLAALALTRVPTEQAASVGDTYNNSGVNLGHIGPVTIGRQQFEFTPAIAEELLAKVAAITYDPSKWTGR